MCILLPVQNHMRPVVRENRDGGKVFHDDCSVAKLLVAVTSRS